MGGCCTGPDSGTFDVDANEVLFRKVFCQSDGVFPLSAAQFQNYRKIIAKKLTAPFALQFIWSL